MTRVKAGVSQAAVVNATIPNPSNLIVDAAAYLAEIIVLHDVGGQISFRGIDQRVQNVGGPTSRFSRVKPALQLIAHNTYMYKGTRKVRPRASAWYYLFVEATRRNLILPDLPGSMISLAIWLGSNEKY